MTVFVFLKKVIRRAFRCFYNFIHLFGTRYKKKKKQIKEHSNDWVPLTFKEKLMLPMRDRPLFTILKNLCEMDETNIKYFISETTFESDILPKLNAINHPVRGGGVSYCSVFHDKNYFELFMPEFKMPETLIHKLRGIFYDNDFNVIDENKALSILNGHDKVVFKQSRDSGGGDGVALVGKEDYRKVLSSFSGNYIVQKLVKQCSEFARYNESSVNICRLNTLLWKGEFFLLSQNLRVGAPGSFCDHTGYNNKNPYQIPINPDGTFQKRALEGETLIFHDNVHGQPIIGGVPKFDEMVAAVKKAHYRFPDYGLLGWDLTVDEAGDVVLIEFNSNTPAIVGVQYQLGPVLMQKTSRGNYLLDEILAEPFNYDIQSIV